MKASKRSWSVEEKVAILQDIGKGDIVEGCRKHQIYPSTYYLWRNQFQLKGEDGLRSKSGRKSDKELKRLEKENLQLKKLLAEKELESSLKDELLKKKIAQWKSEKR
jgi:putative transposase